MIIAMLLTFGVLLLAFTDIVGIQVAGSIVMWMNGYRGIAQQSFVDELKKLAEFDRIVYSRGRARRPIARSDFQRGLRGFGTQNPQYSSRYPQRRIPYGSEISARFWADTCGGGLPHPNTLHAGRGWSPRNETALDAGNEQSVSACSLDSRNCCIESRLSLLQRRSDRVRAAAVVLETL